jgi:uncharacterized membrane protein
MLTENIFSLFPLNDWQPYVGLDRRSTNVFLCCGHGATGWSTSGVTANVLADAMFPPVAGIGAPDAERLFLRAMMNPHRFEGAAVVQAFALFL